jgi:hypothetical protein
VAQEESKIAAILERLAAFEEKSRIREYVEMQKRPIRYFLMEFVGGLSRGLGMAIGLTVILGLIVFIITFVLSKFITLPLIGQYIAQLLDIVNQSMKQLPK